MARKLEFRTALQGMGLRRGINGSFVNDRMLQKGKEPSLFRGTFMKNLWILGFAVMALALLIVPGTPGTVAAEEEERIPSVPTNVEIELTHSGEGTGQARKFAAIVSWEYDPSDDGYAIYLLTLRTG